MKYLILSDTLKFAIIFFIYVLDGMPLKFIYVHLFIKNVYNSYYVIDTILRASQKLIHSILT